MADEEVVRDRILPFSKVSWDAIWAGVMVTMGLEALFVSFGLFIGALFGGSVVWNVIWFLVTMAVSFYFGARTTARLSEAPNPDLARMNGLATWGLAIVGTLVIGIVVTSVLAFYSGSLAVAAGPDWGSIELWFGSIWGGVIVSLLAAYAGGHTQPSPTIAAGVHAGVDTTATSRRRVAG